MIYWQSIVEYGQYSANMSQGLASESEALARVREDVAYLREQGAVVRGAFVQWFCAGCDGKGEVFTPGTVNKHTGHAVTRGRSAPCPQCMGMNPKGEKVAVAI